MITSSGTFNRFTILVIVIFVGIQIKRTAGFTFLIYEICVAPNRKYTLSIKPAARFSILLKRMEEERKKSRQKNYREFIFLVPRTGFEPAHPCERCHLKAVRLPISPSGQLTNTNQERKCKSKKVFKKTKYHGCASR